LRKEKRREEKRRFREEKREGEREMKTRTREATKLGFLEFFFFLDSFFELIFGEFSNFLCEIILYKDESENTRRDEREMRRGRDENEREIPRFPTLSQHFPSRERERDIGTL
jgi:hypothetical protein